MSAKSTPSLAQTENRREGNVVADDWKLFRSLIDYSHSIMRSFFVIVISSRFSSEPQAVCFFLVGVSPNNFFRFTRRLAYTAVLCSNSAASASSSPFRV